MSIASHGLEDGRDYELTIGSSFLPGKAKEAYHLMRYDFKPASIDTNRPAEFVVGENNQCTVTIPNIQDSGTTTTTYKGGKKPCTKECVLIIDKRTGQITLERITSSIPLKKCRADKESTGPKAHSELENLETIERSGNLKKLLKGRDKSAVKRDNRPEKKSTVQSKPNKEASSLNTKVSKSTISATSTLNTATTSTPAPASAIHNSIGSTNSTTSSVHSSTVSSNSSSKINTNPPNASATIPKKRLMSGMSVSSTSSDSSDSDSGDEEDPLANQLESFSAGNPPPKSVNPPPKSVNPPPKSVNPPQKFVNGAHKPANPPLKSGNPLPKSANPPPKSANPPPKPANPPPKPANQPPKPANQPPKPANPPPKPANPPPKPANPPPKPGNPPPKPGNPPPKPGNPPPKPGNPPPKPGNPPPKPGIPPPKPGIPPPKPGIPPPKPANQLPKPANQLPKPANQLPKPANPLPKPERPPAAKMERNIKSDRSAAPPVKVATVKGKEKSFLSTLQSDLQLSDSNSDSD